MDEHGRVEDLETARRTHDTALLDRLAESADDQMVQTIVRNAATPTTTLWRLALRHPVAATELVARITSGDALDALVLEAVDDLSAPPHGADDWMRRRRLEQVLIAAAGSPLVSDSLARAVADTGKDWSFPGFLDGRWPLILAVIVPAEAKHALLFNPAVSREVVLAVGTARSAAAGKAVVSALASGALGHLDERTRQELCEHVLTKASASVRGEAYRHLPLPTGVLERAVDTGEVQVRKGVARRTDCPPHLLAMLLHDTTESVAQAAARNPALPESALIAGLVSRDTSLHPHLLGTLRRLTWAGRHPDPRVRRMAAAVERRPEVIARLAEDEDDLVRAGASARLLELLAAR
ncbi:MAG TPA: hypothetical protein VFR99_03905 [Marmoricola sp.]|nr:hypothetical protein [Marmoricola sp.]